MIVKTFLVTFLLSVGLLRDVTCASYSNVYVESEVVPIGYYRYEAPYTSIADPRISQINALPHIAGYVAPCGSPCVFPAQTVAPVNPNPNVLTYSAPPPNVPVVITPTKEAATGYEYSYAVYDENTGDHKAQREHSDGSVVRGEYSFIQPDGYVREVQYVADDISGFNAVVKNFLPVTVEGKKKVEVKGKSESSPPLTIDCHEIKTESFKQGSNEKLSKDESAEKQLEHYHGKSKESIEEDNSKETHNKQPKHKPKAVSIEESEERSNEKQHKSHPKNEFGQRSEENSKEEKLKHSKEESGEEVEGKSKEVHLMKSKHSKEQSGEEFKDKSKENQHLNPKHSKEESGENSEEKSKESEEKSHKESKESGEKSKENQHSTSKTESNESGEESEEVAESKESKEDLKKKSQKKTTKHSGEESHEKHKNKSKMESKESSEEDSKENIEKIISHNKHQETYELLKPQQEPSVPYNDILRCIQAAMRSYGVPSAMRQEPSPLTYIVLNKPC